MAKKKPKTKKSRTAVSLASVLLRDIRKTLNEIRKEITKTRTSTEGHAAQQVAVHKAETDAWQEEARTRREIAKGQEKSALWSEKSYHILIAIFVLLCLCVAYRWYTDRHEPPTTTALPSQAQLVQAQLATAKADTNDETAALMKAELDKKNNEVNSLKAANDGLKEKIENDKVAANKLEEKLEGKLESIKNDLEKKIVDVTTNVTAKKQGVDEVRNIQPQIPAKEVVAVPMDTTQYMNVLLIDNYDRVQWPVPRVRVSDITPGGKQTTILTEDGKIICWSEKIMFSRPYTKNGPQKTGTILYTPKISGAAAEVINVASGDVYQNKDGSLYRFDDHQGNFPIAQNAAGFTDAQVALPILP
jgi:hypothetical protein